MLAPNPLAPTETIPPEAPPKWHDVTIVTKSTYECARVEAVPPEEFGIERNARTIYDAGYVFHEVIRRQQKLIEDGYDEDVIDKLPTYVASYSIESQSRDTVQESNSGRGDEGVNRANRMLKITEHYVRMDYEGDGKPRLYRVTTGGDDGVILTRDGEPDVVEEDHICFAAMTPVIVTHRFFGRSIADLVMDIQRIKTALLRGLLDHVYAANNPRPVVSEVEANESTLDDLLVSRHGAPIRVKANAPGAIAWQMIPDIGGHLYPAIQYMDATREWRTGVSRQGQGVDPNALQNQVATIANQMFNAAQMKVRLIARIFAETGIKDLFCLLHATIRKHGSKPQTVRLRNRWVNVDPRDWKQRNDMTISVGLGTGSKSEQIAMMQLIVAAQEKAIAAGLVSQKNLWESAKELTKLSGHKDAARFFTAPGQQDQTDPISAPIQPPDPNGPKMAELQARAEIEKLQAQADITTQQQKTAAEMQMARERHAMDMERLRAEMVRDEQKHRAGMAQSMMKGMMQHAAKQDVQTQDGQAPQDGQQSEPHPMMEAIIKLTDQLEKANAPRKIVRDAKGKAISVEVG